MSGLEVLGVAASILQIAEIGGHLSIKLCTFCSKVKSADQRFQGLSSDVSLTSNVLRQLGDNLQQDYQAKLYSGEAVRTSQEVLEECQSVFEKIENAIESTEGNSTKGRFQRAAQKVGFVLIEHDLDLLRSNLERLKSTMLLLLNVIMYAGQIRSRADSSVLEEQRLLIQTLIEEKKMNQKDFESLSKALEASRIGHSAPPVNPVVPADSLPIDLKTYCSMIQKIMLQIDECQSSLDQAQYARIREGIGKIHKEELIHYSDTYGDEVKMLVRDNLRESLFAPANASAHKGGSMQLKMWSDSLSPPMEATIPDANQGRQVEGYNHSHFLSSSPPNDKRSPTSVLFRKRRYTGPAKGPQLVPDQEDEMVYHENVPISCSYCPDQQETFANLDDLDAHIALQHDERVVDDSDNVLSTNSEYIEYIETIDYPDSERSIPAVDAGDSTKQENLSELHRSSDADGTSLLIAAWTTLDHREWQT